MTTVTLKTTPHVVRFVDGPTIEGEKVCAIGIDSQPLTWFGDIDQQAAERTVTLSTELAFRMVAFCVQTIGSSNPGYYDGRTFVGHLAIGVGDDEEFSGQFSLSLPKNPTSTAPTMLVAGGLYAMSDERGQFIPECVVGLGDQVDEDHYTLAMCIPGNRSPVMLLPSGQLLHDVYHGKSYVTIDASDVIPFSKEAA